MPRRYKPELCVFNVTIACLLFVAQALTEKSVVADIKNKLSNLLPKIPVGLQSLFFHTSLGLGRCLRRVHQTQVWGALKKVWKPLL